MCSLIIVPYEISLIYNIMRRVSSVSTSLTPSGVGVGARAGTWSLTLLSPALQSSKGGGMRRRCPLLTRLSRNRHKNVDLSLGMSRSRSTNLEAFRKNAVNVSSEPQLKGLMKPMKDRRGFYWVQVLHNLRSVRKHFPLLTKIVRKCPGIILELTSQILMDIMDVDVIGVSFLWGAFSEHLIFLLMVLQAWKYSNRDNQALSV
ncbi:hypothetical protein G5I_04125 [Acromyrmex echinatior]|uniref:Uncharacterized protein n=1 Tax=Acromyrmex echinatior TaxID=103372 RepID=F4WES8_ACREC|nr:hypothetical protein G5I_04125 [Acromyrmex echinatior]